MSTIARDMQQLAIQFDVTVFSLSQLSNSAGKDVTRGDSSFIPLKGAGELYASMRNGQQAWKASRPYL